MKFFLANRIAAYGKMTKTETYPHLRETPLTHVTIHTEDETDIGKNMHSGSMTSNVFSESWTSDREVGCSTSMTFDGLPSFSRTNNS